MDWDLKVPSWDLSGLDRDAEPNISIASSSSLGCQRNELGCSVDLKLGRFGDSGSFDKWKEQLRRVPMTVVSTSGSLKRTRVQSNRNQSVCCLVDGCKSDLSNCRGYHRRHKVCEVHSKTPTVLVGGQEQRFCQQCSRFHLLVEFDEVKRSCRKRLDGHNRRRRKSQPDLMNSRSLFLNLQAKNEADSLYAHQQPFHLIDRQQQIPSSYFHSHKDGMQFPFLQDDNAAISIRTPNVPSVCQPLDTVSSSESCNRRNFTGGLTQVLNSDRALSLLSSPTIYTPTISLQNMAPSNEIRLGTQHYGNLGGYSCSQISDNVSPTGFSCSRIDDGQASTALVSDTSDAALHCHGIFPLGSDGSSDGHFHALPLSWAAVKSPEVSTITRNLDCLSVHFV